MYGSWSLYGLLNWSARTGALNGELRLGRVAIQMLVSSTPAGAGSVVKYRVRSSGEMNGSVSLDVGTFTSITGTGVEKVAVVVARLAVKMSHWAAMRSELKKTTSASLMKEE